MSRVAKGIPLNLSRCQTGPHYRSGLEAAVSHTISNGVHRVASGRLSSHNLTLVLAGSPW